LGEPHFCDRWARAPGLGAQKYLCGSPAEIEAGAGLSGRQHQAAWEPQFIVSMGPLMLAALRFRLGSGAPPPDPEFGLYVANGMATERA
jgi:hypothetical protein